MDRGKTSPTVLLIAALLFVIWSVVLVLSPGGSESLEWLQLIISVLTAGYAAYAFRQDDSIHNRRCRYILVGFAVAGAVIVIGLSADQNSSRTWARLGWSALLVGFIGSLLVWYPLRERRAATIVLGIVGAVVILSGIGLTVNCDRSIQRTWCDPVFEREQALAEQVGVEGELVRSGRAGGSAGAAQMVYSVSSDVVIPVVVTPPGEWQFEEQPLQNVETQRGHFLTNSEEFRDCEIDVKIDEPQQGDLLTIYVRCGVDA